MVKKYGAQTGIGNADKNNPEAQHVMAELFTSDNADYLTNVLGREPNESDLYAAHFLGRSGAAKLIKAQGTRAKAPMLFPEAARANRRIFYDGLRPRTVEEVYQVLQSKISNV